jgi:hypothetical protein
VEGHRRDGAVSAPGPRGAGGVLSLDGAADRGGEEAGMRDPDQATASERRGATEPERVARLCDDLERDRPAFVAELLRRLPADVAGAVVDALHVRRRARQRD